MDLLFLSQLPTPNSVWPWHALVQAKVLTVLGIVPWLAPEELVLFLTLGH